MRASSAERDARTLPKKGFSARRGQEEESDQVEVNAGGILWGLHFYSRNLAVPLERTRGCAALLAIIREEQDA